ncbi:MAG TPA: hypothetical protein VNS58_31780 [Puia sp.]|nr:hypothetical protein [Puia sp.]
MRIFKTGLSGKSGQNGLKQDGGLGQSALDEAWGIRIRVRWIKDSGGGQGAYTKDNGME